jgi:hypothetical protein
MVTVRLFPAGPLLIGFSELVELPLPPHAIARIENIAMDSMVMVFNMIISSKCFDFVYTYPKQDTLRRTTTPAEKPAWRIDCFILLDQKCVMAQV